ncbi:ABC transporter permease [Caulobacter hibisci]|uniref:ABC transporter permease n=1 Tax=Caulobacter hibisci TaxID=2035993 RepID=A0ABS0SXC0_9CAUL|nr:ABC transporter permease [Caulobacter hibisci]MBI1683287.1 ABC transporter permease [Caulobacter hibisci]
MTRSAHPPASAGRGVYGDGAGKLRKAVDDLVSSLKLTEVWAYLGLEDVMSRYRQTLLGPLWNASFIVGQALALSVVFGAVFKAPISQTMPYILSGMLAWFLGPAAILDSSGLFLSVAGTIKTQSLPYLMQLFRVALRNLLIFLHNLVALVVIFPLFGQMPILHWTIVLAIPLLILACLPYMLLVGMLCARFRDVQMLLQNFSPVLFFLTPVFWNPAQAAGGGGGRSMLVVYNPLSYMVDFVRKPLLNQYASTADWVMLGCIFAVGVVLAAAAFVPFRSKIPHWV